MVHELEFPTRRRASAASSLSLKELADKRSSSLKPQRTPLQTKRSKRCPVCRHILIKPDPKASSTRYKIKLVASNYLPAIQIKRRVASSASSSRLGASSSTKSNAPTYADVTDGSIRPGRTYTYAVKLTNPLYEPIRVKMAVARPPAPTSAMGPPPDDKRRPPFAVQLPVSQFNIEAFAEEWEYDQDDDDDDDDDDEDTEEGGKGFVSKKWNSTTVLMDVAVSKDAEPGPQHANMLVTYVYTDELDVEQSETTTIKKAKAEKTFTFWTLLFLGNVEPRPVTNATTGEGTVRKG